MYSIYRTHTGRVRQVNQDYGMVSQLDDRTTLVIVADGMGGHNAGEVASKMATDIIHDIIIEHWQQKEWNELLVFAVEQANSTIAEQGKKDLNLEGMGTTVEVALLSTEGGLIAHVGDSRVYLWQGSNLKQLTEDHSLVFALYKSGQITFDEIETHPQKNMILRAVGTDPVINIDTLSFSWELGDRLLVCSDGLFKHVNDQIIADTLGSQECISILADKLMQDALDAGGDDNITLILIENSSPGQGGAGE